VLSFGVAFLEEGGDGMVGGDEYRFGGGDASAAGETVGDGYGCFCWFALFDDWFVVVVVVVVVVDHPIVIGS